jgi:hypothetical protein
MNRFPILNLIILATMFAIVLLVFPSILRPIIPQSEFFKLYSDLIGALQTFGAVLLAVCVVLFFATYLGLFDDLNLSRGKALAGIEYSIALLREDFKKTILPSAPVERLEISDAMKAEFVDSLREFIGQKIPDALIAELNEKYSKTIFDEKQMGVISGQFRDSIDDLKEQLIHWRKNANANLVIGLAAAVAGLVALYFTLLEPIQVRGSTLSFATDRDAILYFASRFSLVLIVESVAFFFLKLYREDRSMIRYLRNEITNIEMKVLALRSSIPFASRETLEKILDNMANTERNFVVKKGDRIISDIQYENSEIMIERILEKLDIKGLLQLKPKS